MASRSIITASLVLTGLLSCAVLAQNKKDYKRAPVNAPDTFRGSDPANASDPASIGDLKWFDVFKDPELQTLVRTALQENHDLRKAIARIEIERSYLGLTRSNQYPQIGGSASVTNNRTLAANSVATRRTFGQVLLNLFTFEIDVWGRLRQQTKAARAELNASEEDRKAIMTLVVSDVAAAYFNLLELDNELDIAKSTLAARQNSLKLITLRQQGGLATMLDVRQSEELVYQAAQAIPETEREIEQTENQINALVGNNPGPITRGQTLADQQELPQIPAGLPSTLLERRPDIRAAEYDLEAQHALIFAAKAAYFPQISLTSALGIQSNQLSGLFTGPSGIWSFIPQIAQPIFTAGKLKSNVKLAEAQQQLALAQYEQTIQTAFREVSDALTDYRKIKEVRAQRELLLTTLQDRSRLAHLRYNGGVDSLLNVLDADRDLFNAQLEVSQIRRNELLSLVQLYKALGGGWQP